MGKKIGACGAGQTNNFYFCALCLGQISGTVNQCVIKKMQCSSESTEN